MFALASRCTFSVDLLRFQWVLGTRELGIKHSEKSTQQHAQMIESIHSPFYHAKMD